jgi:protoporphyrinogen oxidase
VLVEGGPRTIRCSNTAPGVALLVYMIAKAGLKDDIAWVPKSMSTSAILTEEELQAREDAVAAVKERYLWMGETGELYQLPGSIPEMLGDANMRPILWHGLLNAFREQPGPALEKGRRDADESIAEFARKFLGEEMVNTYLSGMIHGIWAGDSEQLSAESFLRSLRFKKVYYDDYRTRETSILEHIIYMFSGPKGTQNMYDHAFQLTENGKVRPFKSIVEALDGFDDEDTFGQAEQNKEDDLMFKIIDSSVFYMKHGLGQAVEAIKTDLLKNSAVTIHQNCLVESILPDSGGVKVRYISFILGQSLQR